MQVQSNIIDPKLLMNFFVAFPWTKIQTGVCEIRVKANNIRIGNDWLPFLLRSNILVSNTSNVTTDLVTYTSIASDCQVPCWLKDYVHLVGQIWLDAVWLQCLCLRDNDINIYVLMVYTIPSSCPAHSWSRNTNILFDLHNWPRHFIMII